MAGLASPVPVSEGSEFATTREVGAFRVTHARFSPRGRISPHHHDRACIAVMLAGSFELAFPGRSRCECAAGSLTVEPVGDTHCNCIGIAGAEVLVVQPDPSARELLEPVAPFLDGIRQVRDSRLGLLAGRMAHEIQHPDGVSPLALEALALELLVLGARTGMGRKVGATPPWLDQVEAALRARLGDPPGLEELARDAGVHPAHLARTFRRHYRCSVGGFLRDLRVEAAADALAHSDRPIAQVAAEAGFADQSHLTRRFREQMGTTPAKWRQAWRR
jgi:AraC family transcriptional regulator